MGAVNTTGDSVSNNPDPASYQAFQTSIEDLQFRMTAGTVPNIVKKGSLSGYYLDNTELDLIANGSGKSRNEIRALFDARGGDIFTNNINKIRTDYLKSIAKTGTTNPNKFVGALLDTDGPLKGVNYNKFIPSDRAERLGGTHILFNILSADLKKPSSDRIFNKAQLDSLLKNQGKMNLQYFDRDGNPATDMMNIDSKKTIRLKDFLEKTYYPDLNKTIQQETREQTLEDQNIGGVDTSDREQVIVSDSVPPPQASQPSQEAPVQDQQQEAPDSNTDSEVNVSSPPNLDKEPEDPFNDVFDNIQQPYFQPGTRNIGTEARILQSYIGKEAFNLGINGQQVESIKEAKWGDWSPIQDRLDALQKQMDGESLQDTGKEARSIAYGAASRGIKGAATAAGTSSTQGAESSFAAKADRLSAQNIIGQQAANIKDKDDARAKLIKLKSDILGTDIAREEELLKLKGKVAVGLAGQQLTAAQIAQQNFLQGITKTPGS